MGSCGISYSGSALVFVLGITFLGLYKFLKTGGMFYYLGLILLSLSFGIFWFSFSDVSTRLPEAMRKNLDSKIVLNGTVSEEPDEREKNTRLIFIESFHLGTT